MSAYSEFLERIRGDNGLPAFLVGSVSIGDDMVVSMGVG